MTTFQKRACPVRKFNKRSGADINYVSEFSNGVYEVVKKIPRGQVLSYAQVSWRLGSQGAARAVGNALNKNRDKQVPCHRVVRSDGRVGGFNGGEVRKIALLKSEGIKIKNGKMTNL